MDETVIEIINLLVGSFAAIASGVAAWKAYSIAKISHDLEKKLAANRQGYLKNEIIIKKLQELMLVFGKIHVTAKKDWGDERQKDISNLLIEMEEYSILIKSLDPELGEEIEQWSMKKNRNDQSISYSLYYELRTLRVNYQTKYKDFMFEKSKELKDIHDAKLKKIIADEVI